MKFFVLFFIGILPSTLLITKVNGINDEKKSVKKISLGLSQLIIPTDVQVQAYHTFKPPSSSDITYVKDIYHAATNEDGTTRESQTAPTVHKSSTKGSIIPKILRRETNTENQERHAFKPVSPRELSGLFQLFNEDAAVLDGAVPPQPYSPGDKEHKASFEGFLVPESVWSQPSANQRP
ncbi:uncharacterized protein LOC116341168 [Contarinia nasturtii]|uniref:uncharacterized protein LOC116341168 n=1 Tax=Contarinia nasturtii TaxID=265458 RepID=UPI0012D406AC|nr:uncharacterized protein LOC116341168 [Contarinia nasturtii]